jgi:glycosyltransferase involved in cell wall biosynthesis
VISAAPFNDLRVLAFCDYFTPHSQGGSERAALQVYRRLVAGGASVRVVTATNDPVPAILDGIAVDQVPLIDLSRLVGSQVAVAPALLRRSWAAAASFRPSVLHANTLFFQTSLAAAMLQRSTHLPLVTTVQLGTLERLPAVTRLLSNAYAATAGAFILRHSARAVAVSASVRDYLLGLGVDGQQIDVVHNGVDLEAFAGDGRSTETDRPARVIFVGRLIGNKGPHVFMEALGQLRHRGLAFTAVFVGNGHLRSELERRAKRLGIAELVRFTGQIPFVSGELRAADILVRPSFTEGLPLALLEAMAARVCVVASDIPGNAELVENDRNGLLVPAGNVFELARAVQRLIESPPLRRRLADAAFAKARPYTWERATDGIAQSLRAASRAGPAIDWRRAA